MSGQFISNNKQQLKFYKTPEGINEAAQQAHKAFLLYRNFSGKIKASFLEAIASGIEAERNLVVANRNAGNIFGGSKIEW